MADRVINIMAVMAVILIAIGLLVGVWFGFVGLKVAMSGVILFLTSMGLAFCREEIEREKKDEDIRWARKRS